MTQDLQVFNLGGLPVEIQTHIWSLALPDRTVEFAFTYSDDKPADGKPVVDKWVWEARVHHTAPPSWYRTSRESYKVASDYGFTNKKPNPLRVITTGDRPLTPPDKWLISWDLKSTGRENLQSSPLDDFFKVVMDKISKYSPEAVKEGKKSESTPSDGPFKTPKTTDDQLLACCKGVGERKRPITFPTQFLPEFPVEEMVPPSWKEGGGLGLGKSLFNRFDLLALAKNHEITDHWATFTITLHGKEPRKLDPKLFGDSGKNPVQIVHLDSDLNHHQVQGFQKMWFKESPTRDDRTWPIFKCMMGPNVLTSDWWERNLNARFYAAIWAEDRAQGDEDTRDVWTPAVDDDKLPNPSRHKLSESSKWYIKTCSKFGLRPLYNKSVVFRACYRGHCWEPSNGGKCGAAQ